LINSHVTQNSQITLFLLVRQSKFVILKVRLVIATLQPRHPSRPKRIRRSGQYPYLREKKRNKHPTAPAQYLPRSEEDTDSSASPNVDTNARTGKGKSAATTSTTPPLSRDLINPEYTLWLEEVKATIARNMRLKEAEPKLCAFLYGRMSEESRFKIRSDPTYNDIWETGDAVRMWDREVEGCTSPDGENKILFIPSGSAISRFLYLHLNNGS
jgi:hypothetical protein